MKDKDLDRLFKEKLHGYTRKAPVKVWDRIDYELSKSAPKNRSRRSIYIWIGAAAAVILVFMGLWRRHEFEQETLNQTIYVQREKSEVRKPVHGEQSPVTDNVSVRKQDLALKQPNARRVGNVSKEIVPAMLSTSSDEDTRDRLQEVVYETTLAEVVLPSLVDATPLKTLPIPETRPIVVHMPSINNMELSYQMAYKVLQKNKLEVERLTDDLDVSTILNLVVKGLKNDNVQDPVFIEDNEGILKVDFGRLLSNR